MGELLDLMPIQIKECTPVDIGHTFRHRKLRLMQKPL
jgi:hypothetical protein